jgi:hypothetical protein
VLVPLRWSRPDASQEALPWCRPVPEMGTPVGDNGEGEDYSSPLATRRVEAGSIASRKRLRSTSLRWRTISPRWRREVSGRASAGLAEKMAA